MKNIYIILILILPSCSYTSNNQTSNISLDNYDKDTSITLKETENVKSTTGEREYIDSANYSIIRGKYLSGAKFFEAYENNLTKLDNWKEYYENGNLKEEGIMTNSNHIYVGIWKYYSADGKLDSLINYDEKNNISYFEALEIASQKGYKMPKIEITITYDKKKKYWEIARWTELSNHNGQQADVILIDVESGKVTKPDYIRTSIY